MKSFFHVVGGLFVLGALGGCSAIAEKTDNGIVQGFDRFGRDVAIGMQAYTEWPEHREYGPHTVERAGDGDLRDNYTERQAGKLPFISRSHLLGAFPSGYKAGVAQKKQQQTRPVYPYPVSSSAVGGASDGGDLGADDEPGEPAAGPWSMRDGGADCYAGPIDVSSSIEIFPMTDCAPVATSQFSPPSRVRGLYGTPYPDDPIATASAASYASPALSGEKLFFAHNSAAVGRDGQQAIKEAARQHNPQAVVNVEGYASMRADVKDPVERKIANLRVSMKRAMTVSERLIRSGVPAETIRTIARGEDVSGVTEGDARRVDIYETYQQF